MTHFLLRWKKLGGHVRVRVFTSSHEAMTHGKNGDLIFQGQEWEAFLRCFQDRGTDTITIIPED
jgi:hypothetical protein